MDHQYPTEVIEFGDSYVVPTNTTTIDTTSGEKSGRTVTLTAEDIQRKKNDVKARTTLLLSLPDEYQLRFNNGNKDGNIASVPTASTNVPIASASVATISQDTACTYIGSQSSGSQIKFKDKNHIDEDDMEEMDIKWNMALLSMRADKTPRRQDRGRRDNYRQGSKAEEQAPKALMAIYGVGWDWSYMTNEEEDHALVADEIIPTEFALMTNTSAESKSGLPECVDDTVTDYSRPSPTVETTSEDDQNRNPSVSETATSPITPKTFINFVKPKDSQSESKTDKKETPKKPPVKYPEQYKKPNKKPNVRGNQRNWDNLKAHQLGPDFVMKKKACFNCCDFNHLAYDCRKRVRKSITPKPIAHRPYRPSQRPVRTNMNDARPNITFFNKQAHSYANRPVHRTSAVRSPYRATWVPTVNRNYPPVNRKFSTCSRNFPTANRKFLTASRKFPTGSTKSSTANIGRKGKAVNPSACWFWRPLQNLSNKGPKNNSVSGSSQNKIDDKGYGDSGCSRHMTGNISYLSDYEPFDGGYMSFGQGGCKITGTGTIKTGKPEFENVYFVKDLKDFKLLDDANILLRTHRQHNMYSINLNNIVLHRDLTFLVAKAFADECMLWHRRLGHLNFKTMNELVRHNLVRVLPTKCFENDHTLHLDLFGPTSDEISGILKKFITKIENLKDLKVKIIKCDNGGEVRNKEMNEFCSQKRIKREFSNARTPQQNGVAKRRYKTLIEAARTIVANQEETPSLDNILSLTNRFEDILGGTTNSDDSNGEEADISNMETAITASPTPTLKIHMDHPKIEPKKISDALQDQSWIEAMQEELLQFKIQNVWTLVDCPKGVRPIGTKWVLKNKKDERGIVIRNK
nr:hypothetical protein [Tanacetum cinerariifolium]